MELAPEGRGPARSRLSAVQDAPTRSREDLVVIDAHL
ncbi:hypothetical protein [Bovine papular stomatitis virus]